MYKLSYVYVFFFVGPQNTINIKDSAQVIGPVAGQMKFDHMEIHGSREGRSKGQ